jgi:hypothetical protein
MDFDLRESEISVVFETTSGYLYIWKAVLIGLTGYVLFYLVVLDS